MRIQFSDHAENRLKLRKIPKRTIIMVLENSLNQYYDVVTRNLIAIGRTKLGRRKKILSVVFQEVFGQTVIVTAHPISNAQV